ncbi:MAG: hypothetical protein C0410_14085 [Anaerolinea sp.]|nr:hypothetical protein [Anaerolinea sp.]
MKNNLLNTFLKKRAEEIAPASQINLWPGIQAHFPSHQSVLPQLTGGFKMKRSFAVLLPIGLALMLAFGFIALTPKGQTLAQQFIALFFEKAPDTRPFDPDNGTPIITPFANIAEGEALTGWHIYQPFWVPQGVALSSMEFRPETGTVVQVYGYEQTFGMTASYFFIDQRKTSFNDSWPVGESSQIETVKIGDISGEYVIGAWGGAGDHLEWEVIPQFQHLRWQKDGMYFSLDYSIFGVDPKELQTNPYYLSKDQLITIAKRMK